MHKRYLATKTKEGNYYVCDSVNNEYMELPIADYNIARNFLGILEMSDLETKGLTVTDGDIFCKGSNIDVDMSYYDAVDLIYSDNTYMFVNDSNNVNIYNIIDTQGSSLFDTVQIGNSNNINIYVAYSNIACSAISLDLFNSKGVKLIGMHGKYGEVAAISIVVRTSEQEEVILKGIKVIDTLDLVISDDYFQYQNADFCFFQSEEKLRVNWLNIGVITKTLYNHLINTIENTPKLYLQDNTLMVYVFNGERTEIDLTRFKRDWVKNNHIIKCVSVGMSEEPAQVIIRVNSIDETTYKIECQGEGDMNVTVVDKNGNNIVKEYKKE